MKTTDAYIFCPIPFIMKAMNAYMLTINLSCYSFTPYVDRSLFNMMFFFKIKVKFNISKVFSIWQGTISEQSLNYQRKDISHNMQFN